MIENQSQTKRVESSLVRCLDGGSSPPISTIQIVYQSVTSFTNTFTNTFCKLAFVKLVFRLPYSAILKIEFLAEFLSKSIVLPGLQATLRPFARSLGCLLLSQ